MVLLLITGVQSIYSLVSLLTYSDPVIIILSFIVLSIFGFCLLLIRLMAILDNKYCKPYVIIDKKYYYTITVKNFDGFVRGVYYANGFEMRLRENNACKRCSRLINCAARNDAVVKCDLYSEDERKVKIYGQ